MSLLGVILVRIFFAFSRIRTKYGEISNECKSVDWSLYKKYLSIFSPHSENAGKMRARITPNTDTFYAVQFFQLLSWNFTNSINYTCYCQKNHFG